jgi:iron-sulfur cluster repair protein YtfE (RIC family)
MLREEQVVFPGIEQWERECREAGVSKPRIGLIEWICAIERWHAGLLQMFYLVLRRTRDASEAPGKRRLWSDFFNELSAVCDDFDQHLFEEDCLLLPRVVGRQIAQGERGEC